MAKEKGKRGRPSRYTKALAERICDRLAEGESLRSICRDEDMPAESTVRKWALEDRHGFYTQYARARDIGLDAMADEILDIADDKQKDFDDLGRFNREAVMRSQVRVDARKWYLSKMAPKRYGDKVEHEHKGEVGVTIVDDIPRE